MEYVYAALLLHRLGKPIDEQGLRKVIEAAGGNVDELRLKSLVAALQGINIDEVLKSAAAAPVVAAPAAGGQTAAAPTPAAEAPKEEKKEEKKEEEALSGLAALFG
ncbi:MAG: 50S ribosomal protein P1 [Thaumarchaeota archaeon]|nr:50S ribosomal protein P1 [Candidatus Calditenuaceae archaeon]MDW8042220.1 50S ribosomal protein P1 [Nitrososphaerota archaeon]